MLIFFYEKLSFVDKKMDEKKNKLGELSTKEVQEITDNAIKFGMRMFNGTVAKCQICTSRFYAFMKIT